MLRFHAGILIPGCCPLNDSKRTFFDIFLASESELRPASFQRMLCAFAMLNPINFVRTPEYLFNPKQALQRFRRLWHRQHAQELVRLPWGAVLQVHPAENIGRSL